MTHIEVEAKLEVPGPEALAALPGVLAALGHQVQELARFQVVDRYLDSADWLLRRAGWACRLRWKDGRHLCGLKRLVPLEDGLASREEVEDELPLPPPGLERVGGLETGPLLEEILQGTPLRLLFTIEQERTSYRVLAEGGALEVEASADRVRFTHAGGAEEIGEAELELRRGDAAALGRLAEALHLETGWPYATASKYERGLALAVAAGAVSPPPDLD